MLASLRFEHVPARGRGRPRLTVKVMSVVLPSAETFWTIMSTLIAGVGERAEDRGGDAGPVGDAEQRDLASSRL